MLFLGSGGAARGDPGRGAEADAGTRPTEPRDQPEATRKDNTMNIKSLPKLPSLPKSRVSVKCACGCDGLTQSRFVPGHDSTLKGMKIRVERRIWDKDDTSLDAQFRALAAAMTPMMAEATAVEMGIDPKTIKWTVEAAKTA